MKLATHEDVAAGYVRLVRLRSTSHPRFDEVLIELLIDFARAASDSPPVAMVPPNMTKAERKAFAIREYPSLKFGQLGAFCKRLGTSDTTLYKWLKEAGIQRHLIHVDRLER